MRLRGKGAAHRRLHRPPLITSAAPRSEINVTPLVDVVLVLLIIFMVVTPMLHRGVEIDLPQTKHHKKTQDTGEQLVVSVRRDGTYIDADALDLKALEDRLRVELKTSQRPVHVRADRTLRYGLVRKVVELVHAAGAQNVGLATEEPK